MLTWTRYQLLLAIFLVIGGTINTLSFKWADKIKAKGTDNVVREFNHPFFELAIMFGGEILCILFFKICYFHYKKKKLQDVRVLVRGNRDFTSWIFFLPAACDVIAHSVMHIGLSLTYASSFQMLRGSLIVFVAVLSIGFLGRKITPVEWIGIFFVIIGLLLVGVSDFVSNPGEDIEGRDVLTGDLLIVLAQVISAIQIVLEEHFVLGKNIPPLHAVGLEGCFGVCMMGLLFIPLYYIRVGVPISTNPSGRLEDLNDAFMQIENELLLLVPLSEKFSTFGEGFCLRCSFRWGLKQSRVKSVFIITGLVISIAFYNFAGIGVTKELSGTTRTVLDSFKTIFIWAVSLSVGWQFFFGLQILGFVILIIGLFIYHDILLPFIAKKTWEAITKSRKREDSRVSEQNEVT